MSPATIYLLIEKIHALMSRGADVSAKKTGANQVEITAVPKTGVNEKPYQCENRRGQFESIARMFTDKFAQIDHPACVHKGDDCCRYIISWTQAPKIHWKLIRNYALLSSIIILLILLFVLPYFTWVVFALVCAFIVLLLSYYTEYLEKKGLIRTVETQTEAAQDNILESNISYNNALLVQEIGQATANILDIDSLLKTVAGVMEKRLDFDRGMIMLVNKEKTMLRYCAGYGQNRPEEEILKDTEFHLNNPESRGLFVLAIKEQRPFLVNNISEIQGSLSRRSFEIAKQLGSEALICVPIIYERESLGILAVDNSKSSRPLRQSDMNLLIGVASQLAISIANAMSFEKLHASEKKYRELVENANSIILRVDTEGRITYFNEFAQRFFGYAEKDLIKKMPAGLFCPHQAQIN
jgi:GAF domain-containing protein